MSYVITAISRNDTFPQGALEAVSAVLKELPLKVVSFTQLAANKAVDFEVDIDLSRVAEEPNSDSLANAFETIRQQLKTAVDGVDLAFQNDNIERKEKGLIVFDMDSTLIYQEVIELIAAQAGVEAQVAEITTRAMNGELDFKQSLAARVSLLKGIKADSLWEDLKLQLKITKGAKELCSFMKKRGCKLAVCSGGFLPLAEYVKEQLDLDYAFANVLATETIEGVSFLSGETIGEVVDGLKKKTLLEQLAKENGIPLDRTVAVGDGANDLLMMGVAGVGVAWNAKPVVQLKAPTCLNSDSLRDILHIFGFPSSEF